jgi:hypothetical protein
MHILIGSLWNVPQTDNIEDHKVGLNKLKKSEITPCILSEDNTIKLELKKQRKKQQKTLKHLETDQYLSP